MVSFKAWNFSAIWPNLLVLLFASTASAAVARPLESSEITSRSNLYPDIISGWGPGDGESAAVIIHDYKGNEKWKWTPEDGKKQVKGDLAKCLDNTPFVTETKWQADGTKIAVIMGSVGLILNYKPGSKEDKTIHFGVCLTNTLSNSHNLELLPGGYVAVATTGPNSSDGLQIFKAVLEESTSTLYDKYNPKNVTHIPAVHGLVWDQQYKMLWAAGTDGNPEGTESGTVHGKLNGYKCFGEAAPIDEKNFISFTVPGATQLHGEWDGSSHEDYAKWWDGPHDLVPVPGKRELLVTTDTTIHSFSPYYNEFEKDGKAVIDEYLPGFQPVGNRKNLLYSDIKGISIAPDNSFIYVQAVWQDVQGTQINLVLKRSNGVKTIKKNGRNVYRARWFTALPGWPTVTD